MLEQYHTFCNTFFEVILEENNEENGNLKRIENDYDIDRYKAALVSNIRGALTILNEEILILML
jgi:hypothetical protein